MKNIRQIREEKERVAPTSDEERKLAQLVRAGLFDAKKLAILKRALRKDNVQMTRQERDTLLQLLDVLLDMITGNRQIFTKVKQSVAEQTEEKDEEYSMARGEINTIMSAAKRILDKLQGEGELEAWVQSKITKAEDYLNSVADHLEGGEALEESRLDRTIRDINDLPNIIVLRRRAVRVFPDGYKVVMYWADKINRYIPIPVDPAVITRGLDLNEATYNYLHKKYLGHIEKAHSLESDDPEHSIHLDRAERALSHIKKLKDPNDPKNRNYGRESKVRSQSLGKQIQKKAERQRDYQAGLKMRGPKGILSTASQMAKSGKPGAALGTVVGGAIGSAARAGVKAIAKRLKEEGIEETRIKMMKMSVSPTKGVRKTQTSNTMIRENFQRNLNENRQQIDEVVPLIAAAARMALPAAARLAGRYLPRVAGATKNVVKGVATKSINKAKSLTKKVRDYSRKRKARLAAASGVAAGSTGGSPSSSSTTPDKQHTTTRREVARTSAEDSARQRASGDYATRSTVKALKSIQEGAEKILTFRDGSQISVNHLLAQEIINIYESVNKNNKQLMANMLDESLDSFKKVSKFAVSNRK
jgi:hypothetical protein